MGTEVYELADALLAELLGSAEHARVLARYRADHEWDAESVAVVLQLIEDLHASGRITDTAVRDLRREISSWDLTRDADSTDELPALASFALDDPTEELDDTDVTLVLPPDVEQQLGLAAAGEEPAVMPAAEAVAEPAEDEPAEKRVEHLAEELVNEPVEEAMPPLSAAPEPPSPPPLEPGSILADRYQLQRLLGAGGYCLVYLARDLRREALGGGEVEVALKALRPHLHTDERAVARLKHEYRTIGQLSHPGVVRALDLDCDTGQWFFTMERLEGEPLSTLLRGVGPLPLDRALPLLEGCASALDFAHARGQVHGDLKPANVFVTTAGEVKLIDWSGGIDAASAGEAAQRSRAATRAYASPQVLDGGWPQRADDVFSLACVACEMLSGRHPFDGDNAKNWRDQDRLPVMTDNLPAETAQALMRGLAWESGTRPGTAGEFVEALEPAPLVEAAAAASIAAAEPVVVPPPEATPASTMEFASKPEPEPAAYGSPAPPAAVPRRAVAVPITRPPVDVAGLRRPLMLAVGIVLAVLLLSVVFFGADDPEPVAGTAPVPEEGPAGSAAEPAADAAVTPVDTAGDTAPTIAEPQPSASAGTVTSAADPSVGSKSGSVIPEPEAPAAAVAAPATTSAPTSTSQSTAATPSTAASAPASARAPAPAPAAPVTWISFEAADIVVSEAAVAAVLRVQRLERTGGRVRVDWRVLPGTATPGEDFEAGAAGTAEFADGQSLRAIYIPLQPDTIAEGNETFVVELTSRRRDVRIGPIPRATVTIRDDD